MAGASRSSAVAGGAALHEDAASAARRLVPKIEPTRIPRAAEVRSTGRPGVGVASLERVVTLVGAFIDTLVGIFIDALVGVFIDTLEGVLSGRGAGVIDSVSAGARTTRVGSGAAQAGCPASIAGTSLP
jgi:hypothetical protein